MDKKAEQLDLYKGHHTFVIQLNSLALDRVLARIQSECAHCLSVLFVLKMHADFDSGLVSMGSRLLAEICGCSPDSVTKAVGILEKESLLEKVSAGRGKRPVYQLKDQVELEPIVKEMGLVPKKMSFPFKPKQMTDRVKDIVAYKKTGELTSRAVAGGVHIENLVVKVDVHHHHYYGKEKEDVYEVVSERQADIQELADMPNSNFKKFALEQLRAEIDKQLAIVEDVS